MELGDGRSIEIYFRRPRGVFQLLIAEYGDVAKNTVISVITSSKYILGSQDLRHTWGEINSCMGGSLFPPTHVSRPP